MNLPKRSGKDFRLVASRKAINESKETFRPSPGRFTRCEYLAMHNNEPAAELLGDLSPVAIWRYVQAPVTSSLTGPEWLSMVQALPLSWSRIISLEGMLLTKSQVLVKSVQFCISLHGWPLSGNQKVGAITVLLFPTSKTPGFDEPWPFRIADVRGCSMALNFSFAKKPREKKHASLICLSFVDCLPSGLASFYQTNCWRMDRKNEQKKTSKHVGWVTGLPSAF